MKNIKTRDELHEEAGALHNDAGFSKMSGDVKKSGKERNLVDDFFNKLVQDLDKKYFPGVKWHEEGDKGDRMMKVHHSVELFSNGALTYDKLITQLSAACKDTTENIEKTVSKYIK